MRTALGLALMLFVSGSASAAEVGVLVGFDDFFTGVAYLRYFPETVVVEPGDTVVWTTGSKTPHTVTSIDEAFESSPAFVLSPANLSSILGEGGWLLPGRSWSHTFNSTGKFPFLCKLHAETMMGNVTVVPASGAASAAPVLVAAGWGSGDISVDRFAPQNLTIEVGTTVVWTNLHSAEPHAVAVEDRESSPNATTTIDPAWEGEDGLMSQNEGFKNAVFKHAFDEAGHWLYFCILHPAMWGTVVVLDADKEVPAAGLAGVLGAALLVGLLLRGRGGEPRGRARPP